MSHPQSTPSASSSNTPAHFVLPLDGAEAFGVTPVPTTWRDWVANGGDPRFYPYSPDEYAIQEHWWIAELATYPTADLESELAHITRQIIDHGLLADNVLQLIGAVYDKPILEARAQWLAYEIKRRDALPEPPKRGSSLPSDFIVRLKDALDLPVFLVGRLGFDLKQKGRDWWGPCPFHAEQTPSFVVHENGKWHCFGACQQSGDVFDILLASSTCRTWRAAVEYVADYLHIVMPKPPEPRNTPKQPTETTRRGSDLGIPSL